MYKLPFALIGLVLILLAYFLYQEAEKAPAVPDDTAQTYVSERYGVSFSYPEGYVLSEREAGDAHRGHYAITLVRAEEATPPQGGEGPTGITVDIYQNDIDQQTLVAWVTTTNGANFKLGDGTYASTTVAGQEAIRNQWSGLYEGETTTFVDGEQIIAVSVTRLLPEDHKVAYALVLGSMELTR